MQKDFLYHYGVKGMRWGVRRYQNEDGTLTESGKRRYGWKNLSPQQKQGVVVAGTAIGIGAAMVTKRYAYMNLNKVIKAGTKLNRIESRFPEHLHSDLGKQLASNKYVSKGRLDAYKYKGHFGKRMNDQNKNRYNMLNLYADLFDPKAAPRRKKMVQKTLLTEKKMVVASPKTSRKILQEVVKNEGDKASLLPFMMEATKALATVKPEVKRLQKSAAKELSRGKIGKNTYKLFNISLGSINDFKALEQGPYKNVASTVKRFNQKHKDRGFDFISDMNDKLVSGYKASNPYIYIGDSGLKVIDSKEFIPTRKQHNKALAIMEGQQLADIYGPIGLATLGIGGATSVVSTSDNNKK